MVNSTGMKSDRMSRRSSFGGVVRRTLSDITNSVPQQTKSNPEKTEMVSDQSAKEYIDHLVKENMALARLVADKNKIIELTGTELHKLRVDLQKMQINLQKLQLQNWNLAQSNSHMLAELNIGKDKLKVQQHEASCKEALLKAKNEELKANSKNENNQKNLSQKGHEPEAEQISHGDAKPKKTRRGAPSKSMGSTTTAQPIAEKEVSENKRRCLRRQSARTRSQEQEPEENLFEIGDAKFLAAPSVDYQLGKVNPNSISRKEEEKENEICGSKSDVFDSGRASLGRPSRRAAAKVQSYKETPVNVKMRRPE